MTVHVLVLKVNDLPTFSDVVRFPRLNTWNFFPPNAFLRRRRKKALLRVNDRGGGWKMCILALRRVCVCTYVRAGTSAINLRRYGNTPQTITIHNLVEILLLCAAHATIMITFPGV